MIQRVLQKSAISLMFMAFGLFFIGLSWAENNKAQYLKVGLADEPKTLNIWLASDRWSLRVLSQIYQPLYTRSPDTLEITPWLAAQAPEYNENELSYTIKLRDVKWSDGTDLTAEDVAFTGKLIKEYKIPRHSSRWRFIKKIEVVDKKTVKFYLDKPMAIFLTRTLFTPIVSKKEWEKIYKEAKSSEKPLARLLNHKIKHPVGSGPFILKEWKQGAYLFVEKNKHFFGNGLTIAGRKLGPFIDGIIYKFYGTSDAAILSLKKGSIDMFWWGIQAGYLDDLKAQKDIKIFYNERSALYYMGFNLRKPPFDDVNLRRAVATVIDKDFIITRVLGGLGMKMPSILPSSNRYWYCDAVPTYGDGLTEEARTIEAYKILKKAGYTWKTAPVDEKGKVVKGKEIRLPNGQSMKKLTILTPPADYDPLRAMSGLIIQEWLRKLGIPVSAKPMAFGSLIEQVKIRRDFDAFILAYGRLSLDPDWIRNFFHSRYDRVRGRNMSGYRNPVFDELADRSARTMDREKRKQMVCELQRIIMQDIPYLPLYNPNMIEGVRTDRFSGWVEMLEGIGNIWSFCELKPNKK
jgi:peptide/nickel transport system substrate-binding protein